MVKAEQARGRPHDAKAAQAAIIDAAEAAFAEHGFAGARIDAIAADAGYNKSLIFHYFDDKLGLYEAVLRRAEELGNRMQEQVIGPLFRDPGIAGDAGRFRPLLETAIRTVFDFFVAQPRLRRIFTWEEAEDWQTMRTIWSRFDLADQRRLIATLGEAQQTGVLRPGISPMLLMYFVRGSCLTYLASLPLLEKMAGREDLSAPAALAEAREQIVRFVVHGVMADPSGQVNRLVGK